MVVDVETLQYLAGVIWMGVANKVAFSVIFEHKSIS